jgi:AAA15 family ATPase/GTPase
MSHIVSFSVTELAGRAEPLEVTLNRDTNIFFGLNGSGKTSLLKILHAAMSNNTDILESVPFKKAQVKIYSLNWDKVFTRTVEKQGRIRKVRASRDAIQRNELSHEEIVLADEPVHEEGMQWVCTPGSPRDAATTRWAHQYLSTSRLHVSDDQMYGYRERIRPSTGLTEKELDHVFARSVESLWRGYSARVLSAVRTAQEQGLASILRAVLSPQSASSRQNSKLTSATAYERVHAFLKRQGSESILGKKTDFERRYRSNKTLQDVVQDIDSVEDKIKAAMTSRDTLQELIERLFIANKKIEFTDESIHVSSHSGEKIGLESLSSGEKHLLRILVAVLLVDQSSLMIDEPEISMHVDWQKDYG